MVNIRKEEERSPSFVPIRMSVQLSLEFFIWQSAFGHSIVEIHTRLNECTHAHTNAQCLLTTKMNQPNTQLCI